MSYKDIQRERRAIAEWLTGEAEASVVVPPAKQYERLIADTVKRTLQAIVVRIDMGMYPGATTPERKPPPPPTPVEPGDYGYVVVFRGKHRDRVGYYDDDDRATALVYPAGFSGGYIRIRTAYLRRATKEEIDAHEKAGKAIGQYGP